LLFFYFSLAFVHWSSMGKALIPLVKQELANLDKDLDRRWTTMNALKSYVKLMNTRTLPLFLDKVLESKQSSKASSRQYAISLLGSTCQSAWKKHHFSYKKNYGHCCEGSIFKCIFISSATRLWKSCGRHSQVWHWYF